MIQRNSLTVRAVIAGAAALFVAAASPQGVLAQDAAAQETPAADDKSADTKTKADGGIVLELNKLEAFDKGCRVYVVVSNPTDATYDAYKLDMVMFQPDGIIGRRFSIDLAPMRSSKRTVKPFELDGTKCDGIGSFLVNDVIECRASSGPVSDCLANLKVNSLTKVEISK